tara:strand:+ start:133 stop:954 length:822 start_codon:yes stop_codon:yes gene_type:complete
MNNDENYIRIYFICKLCTAAHVYPGRDEWMAQSKLKELLSSQAHFCPGNQERLLSPHYEISKELTVIDHYDILYIEVLNSEKIVVDDMLSEEFSDEDDAWEIDSTISVEIDSQRPLVDMKMEYKHGDSEIQKMQISLNPEVQKLDLSDANAMSFFVENYVDLHRKAKDSDPELSQTVSEMIRDMVDNYSPDDDYGPPRFQGLIEQFTEKHLQPKFGNFILNPSAEIIHNDDSLQLPQTLDDSNWTHLINDIPWSWEEVVWLVRWYNLQLQSQM